MDLFLLVVEVPYESLETKKSKQKFRKFVIFQAVNLINTKSVSDSWENRAENESLYFAISLSTSFSDLMV